MDAAIGIVTLVADEIALFHLISHIDLHVARRTMSHVMILGKDIPVTYHPVVNGDCHIQRGTYVHSTSIYYPPGIRGVHGRHPWTGS